MNRYFIKNEELVYPELYISDEIKHILNLHPQKPCEPIHPHKPTDRSSTIKDCLLYIILILFGGGGLFIGSLICDALDVSDEYGGFLVIAVFIISIGIGVIIFLKYDNREPIYPKNKYQNDLEKYNRDLKIFENDKNSFFERINIYNQDIRDLKQFRINFLNKYLSESKQRKKYIEISNSEKIKKGDAEFIFYNYLKNCLNDYYYKISVDMKVRIENSYYYPDIIIESKQGIIYDIEIDEPYSNENGTPIHYFELNFQRSIDYQRNRFFQKNEWVIIRFAESQIYKDPFECASFITKVNESILQNKIDSLNVPLSFIVEKWDPFQADVFFKKQYIQTYITS